MTYVITKNVKIDTSLNSKRKYLMDINFNTFFFEISVSWSMVDSTSRFHTSAKNNSKLAVFNRVVVKQKPNGNHSSQSKGTQAIK